MKLYDWQQRDLETLRANDYTGLLNIEPGGGKGHPLDEPVLTPGGWVPVGSLTPGDSVIGSSGTPVTVVDVYDRGELDVYRVTFRDGSSVRVDGDHLWKLTNGSVKDTEHMLRLANLSSYAIPTTAVQFPSRDLPIDPYALGALIADGHLSGSGVQWTKNDLSVVSEMRAAVGRSGFGFTDRVNGSARQWGVTGATAALATLGLRVKSADKFIPEAYLTSSQEQRLALVNGLFDGDGSVRPERGTSSYATTSDRLASDVQALLWSLGVGATKRWKKKGDTGWWQVHVHGDFNPFRAAQERNLVTGAKRPLRRSFRSIEFIGRAEVRCIRVDAPDHLYVTKDYIVTHNTVLAIAAAIDSGSDRVLIIAPATTHGSAWQKTGEKFGVQIRTVGSKNKAEKDAKFDFEMGFDGWYIVTPELFTRADTAHWGADMLIVDESHQLSGPNKKGQRALSGYRNTDKPISLRARYRLALSGTPFRNHFERAWSTARFLWPELSGPNEVAEFVFATWQNKRMNKEFAAYLPCPDYRNPCAGKCMHARFVFTNEKEPGRLISEMPCVIQHFRRRRCCEFHPEGFLPTDAPTTYEVVVPLLPAQRKAIKGLEERSVAWLEDNPLIANIPITVQLRVREMCLAVPSVTDHYDDEGNLRQKTHFEPDAKSPLIEEMIRRLEVLEDEPVVVFSNSQKFAALATARFNAAGISAMEYSGATKKTRDADLKRFGREGGPRVAVVVISAGGTGLDGLQKVCKTEFWAERSLDRTNNTQSEARTDRLGSIGQVDRYIFRDDMGYSDAQWTRESLLNAELALSTTRV